MFRNASTNSSSFDMDPKDGGPKLETTLPALMGEEEATHAIALLRGDDVSGRVAAAHRLDAIATVLGHERTRNELLPFVSDSVDDEDEVLLAMALALQRMVPSVGGPDYADTLLRPLELLLTVEEATVRDAAALSAMSIADQMSDVQFQSSYAAMVQRLANKEWFTARLSAVGLIAAAYLRLSTQQQQDQLLAFAKLCQDETPMVRRVAAQYLGTMITHTVQVQGRSALNADGTVVVTLLPLFEKFASNDQPDSVRLQTSHNCVAFGQVMSDLTEQNQTLRPSELALLKRILPVIVATIDDRSWRVRWTAAAKFALVIKAYDALPDAMDSLIPAYEKLLQDPEAEVRAAATFNLAQVARCKARVPVPPQHRPPQDAADLNMIVDAHTPRMTVAERLVKRVTSLTEDDSEHVRAALAMVATELAPVLGRDATITYLVPPVLLLLRDAASEVRLNLIASLSALNEVIGVDLLSQSLLPAILDLAQDGKWRIRLAIIEHIPLLARHLGKDFFTEKLTSLCVGWLGDDISTIRKAAAANLRELTEIFGSEWAVDYLIPSIVEIRRHDSYLRRLTALQGCSMMATAMDPETATVEILPLVLEMATDPVANIRFNVAKELQTIAPVCGVVAYETQVLPVLTMLMNDDDRDVKYYTDLTLTALEEKFAEMDET